MSKEGTLVSKIRERRKKLGESMADTSRASETSDMELTPRTNRAMMDILSEDDGVLGADDDTYLSSSREAIDDLLDAKKLVDDLTERREETRKELEKTLKEEDEKPTPPKRTKAKAAKPTEEDGTGDKPKKKKRLKKGKKEEADTPQKTEGEVKEQKVEEAVKAAKSGTGPGVNLNQSIRDRLKKKMSQMKEQAAEESKEEESRDDSKVSGKPPTRRLRGMRGKQLATRFDEPMSEDEKKLHETIEAKTQWQKALKAMKAKESQMPSAEEAFDFFTKEFEPEPEIKPMVKAGTSKETDEDEESQKEKRRQEEEEKEIEERAVEDTTEDEPLLGDYFTDADEWKYNPYELKPAQYTPYKDVVNREMNVYFRPSVATVPANQKVRENQEPRYLEDEGFYVGIRPPVEKRNVNIEEQRLIMRPDKGSKWFGDDGRIKALPDPLKSQPTRPPVIEPEDIDPYIQTDYTKAYFVDFDSRFIDGFGESYGKFQLDVDVNAITFTHHSLFSKEHVLASRLQQLWTQYLLRNQKNMTDFLTDKLQALKEAVVHLKKQIHNLIKNADVSFVEEHQTRLQDYKYEIRQIRKLRDSELQNDRQLLKNILKTWKEMKALRESQGCVNTPCKLTVRKEDSIKDDDIAERNKEIEDELDELRVEYEQEYNHQMKQYKLAKDEYDRHIKMKDAIRKRKRRRKKHGSQENLADSDAGESQAEDETLAEPQPPPYEFNEKEIKMKIFAKYNEIRRKPGKHLNVTVSLTSDFTVHFGDIFNIQIVQWPENIRLEVVESSGFSSTVLAQVFIAIPDAQVTSKNVQIEELEFSSDQKVAFNHQGVGSGFKINGKQKKYPRNCAVHIFQPGGKTWVFKCDVTEHC
ncbi:coiled-coil and C2 domain-containing protein 2A-like [Saccoglossus kowalevskii]